MLIGIDPGKSGGVALVGEGGEFLHGVRMPTVKHGKRDLVDPRAINEALTVVDDVGGIVTRGVVIEQVGAMPGQGVSSMFNFGRHTGAVEGWALGTGLPVSWVTPAVWKRYFGLSRDKRASLDRARLEFGDLKLWDVLANDGIAEAALIALWGLRTQKGRA